MEKRNGSGEAAEAMHDAWLTAQEALRNATIATLRLGKEEIDSLKIGPDFWSAHLTILSRYEQTNPGCSDLIIELAETQHSQMLAVKNAQFYEVELPNATRKAFWRGFINAFRAGI